MLYSILLYDPRKTVAPSLFVVPFPPPNDRSTAPETRRGDVGASARRVSKLGPQQLRTKLYGCTNSWYGTATPGGTDLETAGWRPGVRGGEHRGFDGKKEAIGRDCQLSQLST